MAPDASAVALWWAVVVSGVYHGVNPGMGWPLAVSAALMERRRAALPGALAALAVGHFLAMATILLPFSVMSVLAGWEREIRMAAGLLVIGLGLFLLVYPRHPRFLARVPPSRLALWSFLAATAHGAGLMLVPIFLGLSGGAHAHASHEAATRLMAGTLPTALGVALVHTLAMASAGAALAAATYFWLGMRFLSRLWFNLDKLWAVSLVLVGTAALLML